MRNTPLKAFASPLQAKPVHDPSKRSNRRRTGFSANKRKKTETRTEHSRTGETTIVETKRD